MKTIITLGAFALLLNAYANDADTAADLYAARGENVANAKEAAKLYGELAAKEADKETKSLLLNKQAEAIYYVGTVAESKKEKKQVHEKGYEVAEGTVALIGEPQSYEEEVQKASALFWYGANLGKYGEAKGIIASLSRVPELKRAMNAVLEMGHEDAHEYGANRVLGRLYYKLPGTFGGDKDKSEEYLQEAFEETLSDDADVSVHGLNNLYYADTLKANDKTERACEILKIFVEQDPETLLDTRIPETKKEIEEAKAKIEDFDC